MLQLHFIWNSSFKYADAYGNLLNKTFILSVKHAKYFIQTHNGILLFYGMPSVGVSPEPIQDGLLAWGILSFSDGR